MVSKWLQKRGDLWLIWPTLFLDGSTFTLTANVEQPPDIDDFLLPAQELFPTEAPQIDAINSSQQQQQQQQQQHSSEAPDSQQEVVQNQGQEAAELVGEISFSPLETLDTYLVTSSR